MFQKYPLLFFRQKHSQYCHANITLYIELHRKNIIQYKISDGLIKYNTCCRFGFMDRFWRYASLIAKFMGPLWGPSGANRTQVGPMLAQRTLLSGMFYMACYVTRDLINEVEIRRQHSIFQLKHKRNKIFLMKSKTVHLCRYYTVDFVENTNRSESWYFYYECGMYFGTWKCYSVAICSIYAIWRYTWRGPSELIAHSFVIP